MQVSQRGMCDEARQMKTLRTRAAEGQEQEIRVRLSRGRVGQRRWQISSLLHLDPIHHRTIPVFHLACCGGSTRDGRSLLAGFPTILSDHQSPDVISGSKETTRHPPESIRTIGSMAKTEKDVEHAASSTGGFRKL